MKSLLALAAIASVAACVNVAGQPSGSGSPYVSMRVREADRKDLLDAASLAQQGKFDEAKVLLDHTVLPKVVRVAVGTPGPDGSMAKAAVQAAVASWNDALKGAHKLELSDNPEAADFTIDFVPTATENTDGYAHPGCAGLDVSAAPNASRKGRLQVATAVPGMLNSQHSKESLTHLVARGIGGYFGLASSSAVDSLMGPDTHNDKVVCAPAAADVDTIAQIDAYRAIVMEAIQAKKAPSIEFAQLTFTETKKNAGECWRGETLTYEFEYRNNGKSPLEIEAKPSCGCTVAKFDKVVAPGGTGKLVATLKTTGFKGNIGKTIDVFANTPGGGKVALSIAGYAKPTYEILPAEPLVFSIDDNDRSKRELTIRPLESASTKILSVQSQLKYVTATLEPASDAKGTFYKVHLDFAPETPRGRLGMALRVVTDSKREPEVSLPVTFEKGIYAMPPTMFVGVINAETKFPIKRTLSVMRKDRSFKVTGVTVNDPDVSALVETIKEGHEYRVTMECKGTWAPGTVNRKMKIKTDDPNQPEIEVPVLANVMARPGSK
jgi:hypothetical protein